MEFSGGGEFGGLQDGGEVFFFKGFVFQEGGGESVKHREIGAEDSFGASGGFIGEGLDLGINQLGGLLGIRFAGGDGSINSAVFSE